MQPRVERLFPWLSKAKQNKTSSEVVQKELNRVKLLDVKQEKIRVDADHYALLREYDKRRARFLHTVNDKS